MPNKGSQGYCTCNYSGLDTLSNNSSCCTCCFQMKNVIFFLFIHIWTGIELKLFLLIANKPALNWSNILNYFSGIIYLIHPEQQDVFERVGSMPLSCYWRFTFHASCSCSWHFNLTSSENDGLDARAVTAGEEIFQDYVWIAFISLERCMFVDMLFSVNIRLFSCPTIDLLCSPEWIYFCFLDLESLSFGRKSHYKSSFLYSFIQEYTCTILYAIACRIACTIFMYNRIYNSISHSVYSIMYNIWFYGK